MLGTTAKTFGTSSPTWILPTTRRQSHSLLEVTHLASATAIEVFSRAPGSSHRRSGLSVVKRICWILIGFESDAKQFNNTGNTHMMLVADIAFKKDADYLAALNTNTDDSDLLRMYSSISIYLYSRARHDDDFFRATHIIKHTHCAARSINSNTHIRPEGVA